MFWEKFWDFKYISRREVCDGWITYADHGLTTGSGGPNKMSIAAKIMGESTALRSFYPQSWYRTQL